MKFLSFKSVMRNGSERTRVVLKAVNPCFYVLCCEVYEFKVLAVVLCNTLLETNIK